MHRGPATFEADDPRRDEVDFVAAATEVLAPCERLGVSINLDNSLRMLLELAKIRDDVVSEELWSSTGKVAFFGLGEALYRGANTRRAEVIRGWALVFEPLARKLVHYAGQNVRASDDLRDVLMDLGVPGSLFEPQSYELAAALAAWKCAPAAAQVRFAKTPFVFRLADPALPRAFRRGALAHRLREGRPAPPAPPATIAAVLASRLRNEYAHGRWPVLGWLEGIERIQWVLVALLGLLRERMEPVRRSLRRASMIQDGIQCAWLVHAEAVEGSLVEAYDWAWNDSASIGQWATSHEDFASHVVDRAVEAGSRRLAVTGARGVGLSTLRTAVLRSAWERPIRGEVHFVLVPLDELVPPDDDVPLDVDGALALLMPTSWRRWWSEDYLHEGRLVFVVDGLPRVSLEEISRWVRVLERVLRNYPGAATLTFCPSEHPEDRGARFMDRLGWLATADVLQVERRQRGATDHPFANLPAGLSGRAWWMARTSRPSGSEESTSLFSVVERAVGHESAPPQWHPVAPTARRPLGFLALLVLHRMAILAGEAGTGFGGLGEDGFAGAVRHALRDADLDVARDSAKEAVLLRWLREGLLGVDLVHEVCHGPVLAIRLPELEDAFYDAAWHTMATERWRLLDHGAHAALLDSLSDTPRELLLLSETGGVR